MLDGNPGIRQHLNYIKDATQLQLETRGAGRRRIPCPSSYDSQLDSVAPAGISFERNQTLLLSATRVQTPDHGRALSLAVRISSCATMALILAALALPARAQESPYIVTYDHYLEEPGSLEVEYFSTFGTQRAGNDFLAYWTEFEYGTTAWWTTELYLDGQTTFHDSTVFTGFRVENRFRLLQREHLVNPVLYVEYEQISGADKILKEIEGHDVEADLATSNGASRKEHKHELELKLLLSSTFKGWNAAVNPIVTKNLLPSEPWEFAYAIGASRPLALRASPNRCNFCLENFVAGVEMYGGLGNTQSAGLHDTSHY